MFNLKYNFRYAKLSILLIIALQNIPFSSGQICSQISSPNQINYYAADNLRNGTIRLFSEDSFTDLVVYHLKQNKSGNIEQNNLILENGNYSLAAYLSGPPTPLINVYEKLNFSVRDTEHSSISIVSINDQNDLEYSFLFETFSNGSTHLNGRYMFWNADNGLFINSLPFDNSQKSAHRSMIISATFRAFINQNQILFFIINSNLFWAQINLQNFLNSNSMDLVRIQEDNNHKFHRGPIVKGLTAAFILQPSATDAWLCIIKCNQFCLVPFCNETFFDFSTCSETSENWQHMDQFYIDQDPLELLLLSLFNDTIVTGNNTGNDNATAAANARPLIFRNYIIVNQASKSSGTVIWNVFSKNFFISKQFKAIFNNYNGSTFNIKMWNIKTISYCVCATLIFMFLLVLALMLFDPDKETYNVAEAEHRDAKRLMDQANNQDTPNV